MSEEKDLTKGSPYGSLEDVDKQAAELMAKLQAEQEGDESTETAEIATRVSPNEVETKHTESKDETAGLTALELEQYEKGWRPGGPKTAEQFAHDGEFLEEIKRRTKRIRELEKTVEGLSEIVKKRTNSELNTAKARVEASRTEAIKQANVEAVKEADAELAQIAKEAAEIETQTKIKFEDDVEPEIQVRADKFVDFLKKYPFIEADPSYKGEQVREFLKRRNEQVALYKLPIDEHLKILEGDLLEQFPDRFKPLRSADTSATKVTADSRRISGSTNRHREIELTPAQKAVLRHLRANPVKGYTEEDYLKELQNEQ